MQGSIINNKDKGGHYKRVFIDECLFALKSSLDEVTVETDTASCLGSCPFVLSGAVSASVGLSWETHVTCNVL